MAARKQTNQEAVRTSSPAGERIAPAEDRPALSFPIVGIGASAGGLAAFEAFFSGMPAGTDSDMAFVLVQHLSPDHKSILTNLIQRYTRMPVFEVEDGMPVRPNCVYIIPPNRDMAFLNGTLQLLEPLSPHGQRLPIDFFFRSLAQDQHERAIGIILSGTGSDGTLGVRAIKAEGGMVMAQSPAGIEYDGMPRSAIATGQVDYELPPAEMPAHLISYFAHAYGMRHKGSAAPPPRGENQLKKIFVLLRAQTGHDFSLYKPNTVHRRIERRMAVHQIESLDHYVRYLQQTPNEVDSLFRDLLIGVTNFFRDPDAFQALEERVIPRLFDGKEPRDAIRVWLPGCSTGEEAYSIAILLQEHVEVLKKSYTVQIFATDIDRQAIATARAGLYPSSIAADISPERLARFFTAEADSGAYRIHKGIRDMLVFSEQDVIKDPPFSRLDLISCRNLLIYFGAELQKTIIPLFHYALNPGGFLFLGTSETVGEYADLFTVLDRKSKLFQRKESAHGVERVSPSRIFSSPAALDVARGRVGGRVMSPVKQPLRELTEQALLRELAPAAALVNGLGDIYYLHGRTGMYLELPPGEVRTNNILKMAREGLRHELTTALHKVAGTRETVHCRDLQVRTNNHFTVVNVTVSPVTTDSAAISEPPLFLVILEETSPVVCNQAEQARLALPGTEPIGSDSDVRIALLRQQLHAKEEALQSSNEELETANEELKSSNEEMQSVNEELQSTNEELETSKEELQSVNEELATVNAELQAKVAELSQSNNDMNNLLAGTGVATVFVDNELRILRFTPTATRIINLIPNDVGRPVGHIVSNLVGYDSLPADTQAVLNTLIFKEVEVQTRDGKWYSMHIQPYRTLDNVIEGAVITFGDIDAVVQAREALRKANEILSLAAVVRDSHDAIIVQDLDGRILAWNPEAVRMYGWSEAEALAMNVRDRVPPLLREEAVHGLRQLSQAESLEPCLTQRITKDGAVVDVWLSSTALVDEAGQIYAIATTERAKGSQIARTNGGDHDAKA